MDESLQRRRGRKEKEQTEGKRFLCFSWGELDLLLNQIHRGSDIIVVRDTWRKQCDKNKHLKGHRPRKVIEALWSSIKLLQSFEDVHFVGLPSETRYGGCRSNHLWGRDMTYNPQSQMQYTVIQDWYDTIPLGCDYGLIFWNSVIKQVVKSVMHASLQKSSLLNSYATES